jgi:hypothetical protein
MPHIDTGLTVQTSLDPHDSDHVPFIDVWVPEVRAIEGADKANWHVHSADDAVQLIDIDLAVEILRMNTAFVATNLGGEAEVGVSLR